MLLRPGEVVTRKELQQALWPADTFVEFDQGLNTAIRKIRQALGDSAENPRFVETIPRKGYRFIAPVGDSTTVALESIRFGRRPSLSVTAAGVLVLVVTTIGWLVSRSLTRDTFPPKVVPLTTYPGFELSPSFSPDGSEIAFSWGRDHNSNYDIYIKQFGVERPFQLTKHPAHEFSPAWSPKGPDIAFLRLLDSRVQLLLIPQRGGPEELLAEFYGAGEVSQLQALLRWTPNGEWLVTAGMSTEVEPSSIYLVSASTREKRQLTWPGKGQADKSPAVSPDGRLLAFSRASANHRSELHLLHLSADMRPIGSAIKLPSADKENHHPAWTADGNEIIFAAGSFWNESLWRMKPSPSARPRWIGVSGGSNRQPTISRSGNRLAFARVQGNRDVWRVSLSPKSGKAPSKDRFLSSSQDEDNPDYSPTGERIAFISERSGSPEIWLCNADGAQPIPLTSFEGPKVTWPKWSPTGEAIVFYSEIDGNPEVYTIDVQTRVIKRLTSHPAWDGNPQWSRDGRWIYFRSNREGAFGSWKVPAEGGDAVLMSGPSSIEVPIESPDGEYLYFLRKDTAWRVPAEGGEEVLVAEHVFHRGSLAVFDDGVYFVGSADEEGTHPIRFKDFVTGRVETLARTDGEAFWVLTVSPDRGTLLYTEMSEAGGDLMLIEDFR